MLKRFGHVLLDYSIDWGLIIEQFLYMDVTKCRPG
jgi:hypothetical protein